MKYFFAALLLTAATIAHGQKEKIKLDYSKSVNISPFALADVENAVMVGGEYRFGPSMSVMIDLAYIFHSRYYEESTKSTGFNIRPSFRYYFGKRKHEFLQLQGFYKHVNYDMFGWIGKDCVNSVPSYHELKNYQFKKDVLGVNLLVGDILPVSPKAYFDIGVGIGVRFKTHKMNEERGCIQRQEDMFIIRYSEKVTSVSLPFSVKFAYILD